VTSAEFEPLSGWRELPPDEMSARAAEFRAEMARRRTVRQISSRPVERTVIEDCVRTAATAPSGANMQPWHFAIVADPALKAAIRDAAEAEEHEFYAHKAPSEWLEALAKLGTDEHKRFLEAAPYLIAIFAQPWSELPHGRRVKHYYSVESVGIATGLLIAAIHRAGLVSLTHTPSPMGFLNTLLGRPAHERPFLLLVVGYPEEGALVPRLTKKTFEEIASFH
jgi:nitroreductase